MRAGIRMGVLLMVLIGIAGSSGRTEELDLTKMRHADWSRKENGRVSSAHALLAPSDDPGVIAAELRKSYGIRLSSEDRVHAAVVSPGPLPEGARFQVARAVIDRFRHLVELETVVLMPGKRAGAAKPGIKKKAAPVKRAAAAVAGAGEFRIGRAKRAAAAPPKTPEILAARSGANPVFILPTGKLEIGKWWLRVKQTTKTGGISKTPPVLVASFRVKDQRPYQKGQKGRRTPEVGLQKPDSPSALRGMGFGP